MYAWWAAWMGWTLDAFDFTVFLLMMVPIAEEFVSRASASGGVCADDQIVDAARQCRRRRLAR